MKCSVKGKVWPFAFVLHLTSTLRAQIAKPVILVCTKRKIQIC